MLCARYSPVLTFKIRLQKYIIGKVLLASFGTSAGEDGFPTLEKGVPVQHDDSSAGVAADLDVRAGAGDRPLISAARVRLAGADYVAHINLLNRHDFSSFRRSDRRNRRTGADGSRIKNSIKVYAKVPENSTYLQTGTDLIQPEFDKEKASPEGPEMPKYKVNWRKAKEIRDAQFMDNM